ncbi:MFS transporter [Tamlana sedimentorum]|uniref:MFS transporter n=1 Tax=Neotamlana sedimentorum TaxID=1435349 RepID=A0A0D7WD33_9FLAO|nr:MFS transporter [Tamlana sedimentorum]KJD37021.1 MFS transporter [Tamlana sedimentorum]
MNSKRILTVIVFAQFCCTSLWFASNAVINPIIESFGLPGNALSILTSAIQLGFITGTLLFAIFNVADRFPPSKVFFVCAFLAAILNLGITLPQNTLFSLFGLRFSIGILLAGIYPIGMKIASDYFEAGLGKSLSFLVGALVLGTAFPHIISNTIDAALWKQVIIYTSLLATLGGVLMLFLVPNGPYRIASSSIKLSLFATIFKSTKFRQTAFGYFGHMWELYTFWAFVPVILSYYSNSQNIPINVSLWSFVIIASGSLACVFGGYISERTSTKSTTLVALALSGFCCLLSPLILSTSSVIVVMVFLIFWGMVVIIDSPLLSTMVAKNASAKTRGTALTIVNCIGYSLTILSIQLLALLSQHISIKYIFVILSIGPILGVISLLKIKN